MSGNTAGSSVEKAVERFHADFSQWNILLHREEVARRSRGKIVSAGWAIWYLFGADERGEYLDYYASHRMTCDSHVRVRADGSRECLPAIVTFRRCSQDPVEDARWAAEYEATNRATEALLQAKGFGLEGDEPGLVQLNRLLRQNLLDDTE